jgi:hypothetical protein
MYYLSRGYTELTTLSSAVSGGALDVNVVSGGTSVTQYTAGTDSYLNGTTIITGCGVVRRDVASSLVDANDQITMLQVDSTGALRVTGGSTITPVGTHGNLWNNETPIAGSNSNSVDTQYTTAVDFFGFVSGACTLTVRLSQNDSDWYDSIYSYVAEGSTEFHIATVIGARYVRLFTDESVTITATAAAKN